ncbi:MAG: hypothetical protein ABI759_09810 [Candidatus Solibacter sp.]
MVTQLSYGSGCSSTIELRNLAAHAVDVALEGHRGNGSLAGLEGVAGQTVHLAPGARARYRLDIPGNETDTHSWVILRERTAAPPVTLAGSTECREGEQVRRLPRDVAYPMRNPVFAGDVAELRGAMLAVINTAGRPATASACYSAGNLYGVPGEAPGTRELQPICSTWRDVQVPPYGTRNLPVQREGSKWFSVKVRGEAVLLQMLLPAEGDVRTFRVDSTIRFGSEIPSEKR